MKRTILVLQGHPDPAGGHLCHALAAAYAEGAAEGGHEVLHLDAGTVEFPLLRAQQAFLHAGVPDSLSPAVEALRACDHVAIFFPLWLGTVPAVLKGLLEQMLRPGVAFAYLENGGTRPLLAGRSARVVVTMGMPGLVFRLWFGGAGLAVLKRNILGLVGIAPVRTTVLGSVERVSEARRRAWLGAVRALGRQAR